MEGYKYLTYEELENLKKGEVIMYRDEYKDYKWRLGTFLGHFSSQGSPAMKFSSHDQYREGEGWTTVYTGLQFYNHVWTNEFEMWRKFRWPTEDELNQDLLEVMEC